MTDTVAALRMLLEAPVAATVHLDSNAQEGYSFAELVCALRTTYGREHWVLKQTADYVHDQRLFDGVARVLNLSGRLPALRAATTS